MYGLRRNIEEIQGLVDAGRANEARKLIEQRLSELPDGARTAKGALLEVLLYIETYTDNPGAALRILERRRALGFRRSFDRFAATLLAAQLLMKTEQWSAAKAELTELLTAPKSRDWPGLLDALAAYVESDERFRQEMDITLRQHCLAEMRKLGIPLGALDGNTDVRAVIRHAHDVFHASSMEYQRLVLKMLDKGAAKSHGALAREIREHFKAEKVRFFKDQLRGLMHRHKANPAKRRTV